MSLPPTLLNHHYHQNPITFSLLPPPLSTPPHRFSPSKTLIFSSTIRSPFSYSSFSSFLRFSSPQHQHDLNDEELVIGDCLVFEEGIFEDPNLQQQFNSDKNKAKQRKCEPEPEPEDLIPEKWKEVQEEINMTKKERRHLAQQMEFGSKLKKKKLGLEPILEEEYVAYRDAKLSQLKPVVLDNPSFPEDEYLRAKYEVKVSKANRGVRVRVPRGTGVELPVPSSRVVPRNPKLAVYGGTLDDVDKFLNSRRYDPDAARDPDGPRKLFTNEEKVLLNKRAPDLATATSVKWQPLHTLAASGEFYLVGTLLKHNVDINATDEDGLTALHKAILGKKQAIFSLLLRESINPFVRDKEGATLMHYAVCTASSYMIKILLLYNVDINLQDNDGWTPLHLAVQSRRTDIVKLLLIKRADKTLKNRDGLTPLELCLHGGRDTRTYELIRLLKMFPKSRELIRAEKSSISE